MAVPLKHPPHLAKAASPETPCRTLRGVRIVPQDGANVAWCTSHLTDGTSPTTYKIHFPLGLLNSPVVLGPEFLWIETQLWLPDIWFLGEHVGEPMVNPHIWSKKTPPTLRPCAWGGGDRIQGPTDFQWGVWAKILGDVGRESSGRDCGFEWIW